MLPAGSLPLWRPAAHLPALQYWMREVHADRSHLELRRRNASLAAADRQYRKRLGGDPRKLTPPKGLARRTFDRLAQRHAYYLAKLTAKAQERLRRKLLNRPWPTDPAELRALREAFGLLEKPA